MEVEIPILPFTMNATAPDGARPRRIDYLTEYSKICPPPLES